MADEITETSQTVAAGQLRAFIERIERLEEEKKTIADDIKEVYAEMKGTGFDTKAVRFTGGVIAAAGALLFMGWL